MHLMSLEKRTLRRICPHHPETMVSHSKVQRRLNLMYSPNKVFACLFLALLLISGNLRVFAQSCISDLSQFIVGGKTPDADSKIRITYDFANEDGSPGSPSKEIKDAILSAFNQWNSFSNVTGVVFEPAPPGTTSDLQIKPNSELDTPCAGYTPVGERIQFNPSGLQEAATLRPEYAAGIIAHEIGHFLGMNHTGPTPNPPTVMNAPVVNPGDRCKDLNVATSTVQSSDASKASECVSQARQQNTHTQSYQYYEYDYSQTPSCYTYYEVTDYYLCYEGRCSYWYSDYRYMGSTCMLTQ